MTSGWVALDAVVGDVSGCRSACKPPQSPVRSMAEGRSRVNSRAAHGLGCDRPGEDRSLGRGPVVMLFMEALPVARSPSESVAWPGSR